MFVPLYEKSLDLSWLLSRSYAVAGTELSELAVTQLFAELGMEARISEIGKHKRFLGEKIDIFDLTPDELRRHYSDSYTLTPLAREEVPGGLKGKCPATEHIWQLNI